MTERNGGLGQVGFVDSMEGSAEVGSMEDGRDSAELFGGVQTSARTSIEDLSDSVGASAPVASVPAASKSSFLSTHQWQLGPRLLPSGVETRLGCYLRPLKVTGSGARSPTRGRRFAGGFTETFKNTATEIPAFTARWAEHGITFASELPQVPARWAERAAQFRDQSLPRRMAGSQSKLASGSAAPSSFSRPTITSLEAELGCKPEHATGSAADALQLPAGRTDFRQRLELLCAQPRPENLARWLYRQFQGDMEKLEDSVFPLLEERWGFPHQVFTTLWKHLRKATYRPAASNNISPNDNTRHMEQFIEEDEWVEAFFAWIRALHNRFSQIKVSRQAVVMEQTGKSYGEMYFQGSLLGEGSYGEVYLTLHKGLGTERVAKVVSRLKMGIPKDAIDDEVKVLRSLDHPHIIRIYETFHTQDRMYIIMDFAEGGDLASIAQEHKADGTLLPEKWVRAAAAQITAALQYMHSKAVIHCDLKPANVMLLRDMDRQALEEVEPHVLLVDFGLSEMFEEAQLPGPVSVRGTPAYLAPEGFDGKLTYMTDMWALGIIIYELLKGKRPFSGAANSLFALWMQIAKTEPCWEGLPSQPLEVVQSLLSKEPATRLTANECHDCSWFQENRSSETELEMVPESSSAIARPPLLGHSNYFTRAVMFWIAAGFSMKDVSTTYSLFRTLDSEGIGRLSQEVLEEGVRKLGLEQSAIELMNLLDLDQDGYVSYTEFLAGGLTLEQGGTSDRLLRHIFDIIDINGNGQISQAELQEFLFGSCLSNNTVLPDGQTIQQVLREVGGGNGVISYEQFCTYLRKEQEKNIRQSEMDDEIEHSEMMGPGRSSKRTMSNTVSVKSIRTSRSAASSDSTKGTPGAGFPRFQAWMDSLPQDVESHGLRRFLFFNDYILEALYLGRALPRKCMKAVLLALVFIIGSGVQLFVQEVSWVPDGKACQESSDKGRLLWWIIFVSALVVVLLCANVGGLFFFLLRRFSKSDSPWLMAGSFLEVFLTTWGCVVVWLSISLYADQPPASDLADYERHLCDRPVNEAGVAMTLVLGFAYASLLSHFRFLSSCVLAFNMIVAYIALISMQFTDKEEMKEWFWPAVMLVCSLAVLLRARYELELHQRTVFASLHSAYSALKEHWEQSPPSPVGLNVRGIATGRYRSQSLTASTALLRTLRHSTKLGGGAVMQGLLDSLASALDNAKYDIELIEQCLGTNPEDVMLEEVCDTGTRQALADLLGRCDEHDLILSNSLEASAITDESLWGWDTLQLLQSDMRPLIVAAEAVLIPAAREIGVDVAVSVQLLLKEVVWHYGKRQPMLAAKAALGLFSAHWLAHRIGLWKILAGWQRLALLIAAMSLHCMEVGEEDVAEGDAAALGLKEPLLQRVACANCISEILERLEGLAFSPVDRSKLRWMTCHLIMHSRPCEAVQSLRRVRLQHDRSKGEDLEVEAADSAATELLVKEHMPITELIIFAADLAFLAQPHALHLRWAALCQRDVGLGSLHSSFSSSSSVYGGIDTAALFRGLIKAMAWPVYDTLQSCALGRGAEEALSAPMECLRGNMRHWRGETASKEQVSGAEQTARPHQGFLEVLV